MELLSTGTSFDVPLRFLAGVGAGVVATLVMDVVMGRLPEGTTPPSIAAGVLTQRTPRNAPDRLGTVVHYLAGFLTGPLFVWLLFTTEAVVGEQSVVTTGAATAVLYVLMVGFFVVVVLPQSRVAPDRIPGIRRDWAISAAVYLVALVPVVAFVSGLL
jgi:hypothetical protein